MSAKLISVVVPVYNEAENIGPCLRGLWAALAAAPHEILVCYDFEGDSTLPAIAAMPDAPPTVRLVKNDLGRGAACALRAGFGAACGDVIVTTMADLSDEPELILPMAAKIRAGAHVVAGSRYMRGGRQIGGPPLKTLLSRLAGLSLRWVAGLGTHDATSNFRAYSAELLRRVTVECQQGFEIALELTVKAHLLGLKVDEVPSTWRDRTAGASRFQLWKWLPAYMRWYSRGMGAPLLVMAVFVGLLIGSVRLAVHYADRVPYQDDLELVPYLTGDRPVTLRWLWELHNEHRIPLAKVVNYGLSRITRMDARWGALLNVTVLGVVTLGFLGGLRRWRGRLRYGDAFLPLLLLHWGHWENMVLPFQIQFIASTCCTCLLIYQVAASAAQPSRRRILWFGIGLLGTGLSGANGLPATVIMPVWLLWVAVRVWRDPATKDRWTAVLAAALAILAYAYVVLYFVGYEKPGWHPPTPSLWASLGTGLRTLTMGLGHRAAALWPVSLCFVVSVGLAASLVLWHAVRRRPEVRVRAVGLLLCLATLVALALVIGHGRAGLGLQNGFNFRYTTLMCPLLLTVYVAFQVLASAYAARVVRLLLYSVMLAICWPNTSDGIQAMELRRAANLALVADARAGVRPSVLGERYASVFYPGSSEKLGERLYSLATARLSAFQRLPVPATWALDALRWHADAVDPPDRLRFDTLTDGREVLFAHAPTRLRLRVPRIHGGQVRVEFGMLPGASDDRRSDGVEFRIGWQDESGKLRPLWSRYLDPAANASDRGTESAEFTLPPEVTGQLVFETRPGLSDNDHWDWSYWAGVQFAAHRAVR